MSEPAGIRLPAVTDWLRSNAGLRPPLRFERAIGGHSNLTYVVADDAGRRVVLRRPPLGELLPTAHDMRREFALISALHPTPVPVAEPLGICEDHDVTGATFYVMSFIDGVVLHDLPSAGDVYAPDVRRACGESFVSVLAALHAVDPDDAGLGGFAKRDGYIARQLKRWYSQYSQSKTYELPVVDDVHDRLSSSIPEQEPARVVHGDYRLGNCLTAPDGRVLAVLDWEIATLGDPMADVGYVLASWPDEVAAGTAEQGSGFPRPGELLDMYAAASGRDVSLIDWYVAFSRWKSACITAGVYARYLQGALDTTGVDVDGFRLSMQRSAEAAAAALDRLG